MSDHRERARSVDLNRMSIEEAEAISEQIGKEIARLMDECNTKCNQMLNIYGMQTKIHYLITQKSEKTEEKPVVKRRSKKQVKEQSLGKTQE